MHITWHGGLTIKIVSEDKTLVLDPAGLRGKADLVALTNPHDTHLADVKNIQGEYTLLDKPGEYEVSGFALHALGYINEAGQECTLQRWNIEGMTLLHVGALNRELTEPELAALEQIGIDVLFVPVNNLSGKLISAVEPRHFIPVNYDKTSLEKFAKEMGVDAKVKEKKIILKANKLPQDETVGIILEEA